MKPSRSIYAGKLVDFPQLVFADDAAFTKRGQWRDYFHWRIGAKFDGRIIFEIGCFDAAYLSAIAARHPFTGFVGIDWKCKAIYDGARRLTESGASNVVLLRGRAQDIRRIFRDGELDEIWIFHPDPCDREVELKNRLIAEPFLLDAHAVLRDQSSMLAIKTDHAGYYQWVLGLFGITEPEGFRTARARLRDLPMDKDIPASSEPIKRRFAVTMNSADFWHDPVALNHTSPRLFTGQPTSFETRFINKHQPIYYFEARRT